MGSGGSVHDTCFKCIQCGKRLKGTDYVFLDADRMWCRPHYNRLPRTPSTPAGAPPTEATAAPASSDKPCEVSESKDKEAKQKEGKKQKEDKKKKTNPKKVSKEFEEHPQESTKETKTKPSRPSRPQNLSKPLPDASEKSSDTEENKIENQDAEPRLDSDQMSQDTEDRDKHKKRKHRTRHRSKHKKATESQVDVEQFTIEEPTGNEQEDTALQSSVPKKKPPPPQPRKGNMAAHATDKAPASVPASEGSSPVVGEKSIKQKKSLGTAPLVTILFRIFLTTCQLATSKPMTKTGFLQKKGNYTVSDLKYLL